jgi:hypothetical protein
VKFVVKGGPDPWTCRWPDDHGPWELQLSWRWASAGYECTGISISLVPEADLQSITASLVRGIPVQSIIRRAREEMAYEDAGALLEAYEAGVAGDPEYAQLADELSPSVVEGLQQQVKSWTSRTARPQPEQSDADFYREVALVYMEAMNHGKPPTLAVAKHFHVSRPTASRYLVKTREMKLLPRAQPGKATTNMTITMKRAIKKNEMQKEAKDQ